MKHAHITLFERLRLAVLALFFLAAPVAGNIGSCSQTPEDLDPVKFFDHKQNLDCERCLTCGFHTKLCDLACGASLTFPDECHPLVHDGEVCLDVLLATNCEGYSRFMADVDPVIPTECDFCPARDAGAAP